MFEIRTMKHGGEIAFTFHSGYQADYNSLSISMSFYKYGLTMDWDWSK